MLLQEDIDLIKQDGMKEKLHSEILHYLFLAKGHIETAGHSSSDFEKEINIVEEYLKITKQLYLEWCMHSGRPEKFPNVELIAQ